MFPLEMYDFLKKILAHLCAYLKIRERFSHFHLDHILAANVFDLLFLFSYDSGTR